MVALGDLLILAGWWMLTAALPPCRPRRLRCAGGVALASSLACHVLPIGGEQGPVFWTAALMPGALAVALARALATGGGGRRAARRREPRQATPRV